MSNSPAYSNNPEEDDYVSEEDDDFDPTAAPADENVSSDSESEANEPDASAKGRRRTTKKAKDKDPEEVEDAGFENSGDEGVIKKGAKRLRKDSQEDSGGEGGFVKTRSMRAVAEQEKAKRPVPSASAVTIDVDALWSSMKSASIVPPPPKLPSALSSPSKPSNKDTVTGPSSSSDMVTITQTYTFAGKTQTDSITVPRSSAQAKAYFATLDPRKQEEDASTSQIPLGSQKKGPDGQVLFKPLRRVSKWDPNPDGIIKNLPSANTTTSSNANKLRTVDKSKLGWHKKEPKAQKLNVVDKSKLDWAAHVDSTGQKDELEAAARAKGNYLDKRGFLDRVEDHRDEELRNARKK